MIFRCILVQKTSSGFVKYPAHGGAGHPCLPNCPVVFGEQAVAFFVVHHHRIRSVDVWVWPPPIIGFVVVVGFEFAKCLVNDELTGVFDVVRVIHDD